MPDVTTRSPGSEAADDHVVVADHFADLNRLLTRDQPSILLLDNEAEVLAADTRHRCEGNGDPGNRAPHDARTDELLHTDGRRHFLHGALDQYRLRRIIHARSDKRNRIGREHLSLGVEYLDGQADAKIGRAIERHLDVRFERVVLIDGRDHRGGRDAVAGPNRNVPDGSGLRRFHPEELQLNASFTKLRVERRETGFSGAQRVLCLLELLFADRPGFDERFQATDLEAPVLDVRLRARSAGLRAAHDGNLTVRVDLHQRIARAYLVAGLDEDPRDEPFDFRLDGRRSQRPQRRDELRSLLDRFRFERHHLNAGGRWRRLRARRAATTIAPQAQHLEWDEEQKQMGTHRDPVGHGRFAFDGTTILLDR